MRSLVGLSPATAVTNRQLIDGIRWRVRAGTPWRECETATGLHQVTQRTASASRTADPDPDPDLGAACEVALPKMRGSSEPVIVDTAPWEVKDVGAEPRALPILSWATICCRR